MTLAFADLDSIAEARRAADRAYEAWQTFRTWDPADVDRVVEAMARAIAPEAARLGELAAQETGYGNAADKRLKNLFNTIAVSDWLRNVKTLGVLWRDEATKVVAVGEPMGVVAALIPVTNPTSTVIFKTLSA
jgi:acyl-CoA reductase-like NAD-dependent aldehyde dehydrogenase